MAKDKSKAAEAEAKAAKAAAEAKPPKGMEELITQLEQVVDNLKKLFPAFADGVTAMTEAAVVHREAAGKVSEALEAAVAAGVKVKGEKKRKEKPEPEEGAEEGAEGEEGKEAGGEEAGESSDVAAGGASSAPAESGPAAVVGDDHGYKVGDVVVLDWKKKGTLHFAIYQGRADNGDFLGLWKKDGKKPFQCSWDWLARAATADETKEVLSK